MIGRLCNPNADACAQKLYAHLRAVYGTQILMAQQEFPVTGRNDQEMERIRQVTGCLPAMRGLDFMHDDYAGAVQRARDWHNRGGIVSICWHTGLEGKGYVESQAEKPDFDALLRGNAGAHAPHEPHERCCRCAGTAGTGAYSGLVAALSRVQRQVVLVGKGRQ